jgi:hypothetical protein
VLERGMLRGLSSPRTAVSVVSSDDGREYE